MGKTKYGMGSGNKPFEFKLPSGEVCLMRRISPDTMLELGILDKLDSLTTIVQTEHVLPAQGKAAPASLFPDNSTPAGQAALLDIVRDKKKWATVTGFVNTIVVSAVVEPTILRVPDIELSGGGVPDGYRRPEAGEGKLYVDKVDIVDRMAVVAEAVGHLQAGVTAMEPFRAGATEAVAGMANGKDVREPAVGAGGPNS